MGTSNKASSRGGILNLDLCKASICLAIVATVALKNWSFIVYAAQALMILGVAHKCSRRAALPNVALYIAFYGAFAFWCLLSAFWAVSPDRAVSTSFLGALRGRASLYLSFWLSLRLEMIGLSLCRPFPTLLRTKTESEPLSDITRMRWGTYALSVPFYGCISLEKAANGACAVSFL